MASRLSSDPLRGREEGSGKGKEGLKVRLDAELVLRQRHDEISYDRPDPILVARRYREPFSALACALFAYGRADSIVRFLDSLDFALLDAEEGRIRERLSKHYYRFQNSEDVIQFFITLARFKRRDDMQTLFLQGYLPQRDILGGINVLIDTFRTLNGFDSRGYRFLIGAPVTKTKGAAPMKRWMMFLRWMVRKDAIDFGLWEAVDTADLLIPLDTHTFQVSQSLGLLQRKSYDLQAVIELTEALRRFDPADPVRYDFALYRMGQEKALR